MDLFVGAGATNMSLPKADDPALGNLSTAYNLVSWDGNTTAYMVCALDMRGPEYLGVCIDMNNTCAVSTNDTKPYNCTYLDEEGGAEVVGNLSNPVYREDCEMPCDLKTVGGGLRQGWGGGGGDGGGERVHFTSMRRAASCPTPCTTSCDVLFAKP